MVDEELTDDRNWLKLSLVMTTASNPFEKIQAVTSLVLKLLYESSSVFFSFTTGSWYFSNARLTVTSNWLSMSSCGLSGSSITAAFPSPVFLV